MCPRYRCLGDKKNCLTHPAMLYDATNPTCLLSIYIVSSIYRLLLKLIRLNVLL